MWHYCYYFIPAQQHLHLHGCRPRLVIKGDLCLGSGKEQEARVSQPTSGLEINDRNSQIKSLACDVLLVAARARVQYSTYLLCWR